ncbi:MAG: Exodeoxyribonuclease 7 large subunit [Candidatus Uhrbacteria bacterium GW2011_GWF2_39_13]|uniref:Exodeoxyribonuclease 7 large subunit n=1 Tax=Candidatus Uhrbacteria bacterium GW2011_GWF2_39_13 TaxID=1618995 RepID=A0A0G0ML58_9BACT|nr:MAG: Exodeoxyribonuclease 7 large subunit [Candidatus Uhrbacteria bacterium GW2011_GWF2_39_13]
MSEEKIWTVSEANSAVREIIENSLLPFWLQGEIGTINLHRSGHVYLTLKDIRTQIKGVFFGGAEQATSMRLQAGMSVEAFGNLTVYEVRGEYQFSIKKLRPLGLGELQKKFEELKSKLAAEGLFAEERKKKIPMLPAKIGIVTSPDGAAIKDFLQIINRRFPNVNIKIYPAAVQGKGAEKQLARGLKFFNTHTDVDVIVVTRGGGSMEDLWPFNEEKLARAVAMSKIPVISAVGHEIDFTICDFVSDLRVPTPSAAAELVIAGQEEISERLKSIKKKIQGILELKSQRLCRRYEKAAGSYVFREPLRIIREKQQNIDELIKDIENAAKTYAERMDSKLERLNGKLNVLNPIAALKRGYAILVEKSTNKTVSSPDTPPGTQVRAFVSGGILDMKVETAEKRDFDSLRLDFGTPEQ